MNEITVLSVNISEKKGTIKHPVKEITIDAKGIINDAHSGNWHRQVSLLAKENIRQFEKKAGRKVNYGEFAENITLEGMELKTASPLDRFKSNKVELEVTQIGKKCHGDSCAIFKEVGDCVMPKEGIFCRVIQPGKMKTGDKLIYEPKVFKILVVTCSDRASAGEYSDLSGPKVNKLIEDYFKSQNRSFDLDSILIPDDSEQLRSILLKAKKNEIDIIITTGGTGIGSKDITPETVKPLLDKEIPGIMEMIRMKFGSEKPNALASRGVAGRMGNSLIFTLPGSVRAVEEYCREIFKTLQHLIYMLHELDTH